MLARDLTLALNPAYLMEEAGYTPDDWQRDVLTSFAPRQLLLCCRQAGKSSTTSILALHEALYAPKSLTLLLSPSLRQSQEIFRKVLGTFRQLPQHVAVKRESALSLELANGSRIVALPGKEETVRGYSGVTLLVIDEAARVADGLYYSVRPMLGVSGGRIILLSTPFGKQGFFYEEWSGNSNWQRTKIIAQQCPRISQQFLEEERRSQGHLWFQQEYECRFVDTVEQVFASDMIKRAVCNDVQPLTWSDQ